MGAGMSKSPRERLCRISPAQTVLVAAETARQISGVGKLAANSSAWAKRQSPNKHGNFVSPIGGQGQPAAAQLRLIDDVVMDEGGQMDHFDDHGDRQMRFIEHSGSFAAERDEDGAKAFALGREGVSGKGGDLRLEFPGLGFQLQRNALKKGFHRFRNLFPSRR